MRIDLPPALAAAIGAAARAAAPHECCGLVEGVREGGVWQVLALHPARNTAPEAGRFQIDPADHIAARKAARQAGHAVIGCYHSHPGGKAEPSAADLAGAGEDNFLWLIAGSGAIAGYLYLDGTFGLVIGADWVTSSE